MAVTRITMLAALMAGLGAAGALYAQNAAPPPPLAAPPAAQPPASAAPGTAAMPDVSIGPVQETSSKLQPLAVTSLLFTAEEMDRIRQALDEYAQGGTHKETPEDTEPQEEAGPAKTYTYPQFFLESLVYHSPKDWVIRINGQRLTAEAPRGKIGVRVTDIDKDKAWLEWQPLPGDRMGGAVTDNSVHAEGGVVMFTLRANQTFSAYAMKVLEGKVRPMVVSMDSLPRSNAAPGAAAARQKVATPSGSVATSGAVPPGAQGPQTAPGGPTMPPGPPPGNSEGLNGLLDRYNGLSR